MLPKAIMIFAAGFGTRMGELTKNTPKPMLPVAGKPLIDHALDLVPNGVRIVANTHYLPEKLETHLSPKITIFRETGQILETGGGLKNALPALKSNPVYTMNSDAIWIGGNPFPMLNDAWNPSVMDALMMLVPVELVIGSDPNGDFNSHENGTLTRRKPNQRASHVYSGLQIIKTDMLSDIHQKSFSLNVLWDQMLEHNRVHGVEYNGQWVDVGTPEGINHAEETLGYKADV